MKRATLIFLCAGLALVLPNCRTTGLTTGSAPPPTAPTDNLWPERFSFQWDKKTIQRTKFSPRGKFGSCEVLEFQGQSPKKILVGCQDVRQRSEWRNTLDIGFADVELQRMQQNFTLVTLFPPADAASTLGLLTFLTSFDGISNPERAAIETFRKRGWYVAAIEPHAQLRSAKHSFHAGAGKEDRGLSMAAPFAQVVDKRLADSAILAEGAIRYVRSIWPDLKSRPHVIVGASAGAVTLPTIVAKIGKPDAAIFIGGGANLAAISANFPGDLATVDRLVIDKRRKSHNKETNLIPMILTTAAGDNTFYKRVDLTRRDRAKFSNAALPLSRLDPYHTAKYLAGVPVLMLHARFDAIVPAETGDLLHTALGQPERWTYPLGHYGLFAILPRKADAIADWIDTATKAR